MVTAFDRIVIAVEKLDSALADYRALLGCEPLPADAVVAETKSRCFDLGNTLIELAELGRPPGISGLVFAADSATTGGSAVDNSLGLDLRLSDGSATAALRAAGEASGLRVDHLVLRTGNAQGCIDLFAQRLGIRLALDQTVPEWGGRMLFFRTGKLTLEVIEKQGDNPARDRFWGIAYQCPDIERTARELAGRGVELSAIRPGRKAGTRVLTVKSHCLDVPTLLLQPAT